METLGRYLIGATVVAAVVTATPWPAAAQIQLDVMTFNIRTSLIPDGDNAWPYRKELVAETIRQLAPHVVGMQEAIGEQIEYLASALPEYRWLGILGLWVVMALALLSAADYFYRFLGSVLRGKETSEPETMR